MLEKDSRQRQEVTGQAQTSRCWKVTSSLFNHKFVSKEKEAQRLPSFYTHNKVDNFNNRFYNNWRDWANVLEQFSVWSQTSEDRQNNRYLWLRDLSGFLSECGALSEHRSVIVVADIIVRVVKTTRTGPGGRPGHTFRQSICSYWIKSRHLFALASEKEGASAHRVPFFFRKEFLVLSVLLFSSRAVKPPLSRVTDSSPVVVCLPAEKEKKNDVVGSNKY